MPALSAKQPPRAMLDQDDPASVRLGGRWTLVHAQAISEALGGLPEGIRQVDATGIDRIDSLGVLQLLRWTEKHGMDFGGIRFDERYRQLVSAIEDVHDERPRRGRDLGFIAALARLGKAMVENARELVVLISFLGETLSKLVRLAREPQRIRLTSTVHHMEQVGLDAVPLVLLLSFLVGAVIAFLGANVLRDFGMTIFVVELVSIAFLREFGVLLTAIILAGRTASAFTAQIGSMVSREEVDAIRTLGLDPVDLLVLPRMVALTITLPLLTFLAMVAGLAGGVAVGAISLDIPPPAYLARMQDTFQMRHFVVGMTKAPVYAVVIALIGCLEGMQVKGTAASVGERTTSAVVQSISLVIILDAIFALWFMQMGY
ncbi:MAG: ABC transporter permease [Pseudoxanthomonas suwonensis]|nr:ABC transporter permease [Pseudoxanthomonas suwonensis]